MRQPIKRLLDRLDEWFDKPDVVPLKPTWQEWWKSQVQRGVRGTLLTFLKLLLWLLG